MTDPSSRAPRRTVNLPREKVLRFRARCQVNGHIGSTLIFSWLWGAVVRAERGRPLPPVGTQPYGGKLGMQWSQPDGEYAEWTAIIERAGSSVRDVIGELVDVHERADGDLVVMSRLEADLTYDPANVETHVRRRGRSSRRSEGTETGQLRHAS